MSARAIQAERFKDENGVYSNAQMSSRLLRRYCPLTPQQEQILELAMTKLGLSARAYDRILKVARTIADLAASPDIQLPHLQEAIGYRNLDRDGWGN